MVPGFHVLGLGDPLRGNGFRMMQNLVVNFAFVQTINQLFWYFQKQPPMQTTTSASDLYFPEAEVRSQDGDRKSVTQIRDTEAAPTFAMRAKLAPREKS